MAIQTFAQHFIPHIPYNFAYTALTAMDAADEKSAFIMQVPKAGNITEVSFRVHAVTVQKSIETLIETLHADGYPSGAAYKTCAAGTVAAPAASTGYTVTLGTQATNAVRGDFVALVIQWSDDGDPGNLTISSLNQVSPMPRSASYTGSWSKTYRPPVAALGYGGTWPAMPGCWPFNATGSSSIDTGTTPDEIALEFQLPYPVSVAGIAATLNPANGADYDVVLYSTGATLASKSIDEDIPYWYYGDYRAHLFDASVELAANTTYYATIKPTTLANVTVYYVDVASAAQMGTLPGGTSMFWVQRTDAGAWGQTTTRRPLISLIIDGCDDGVAAARTVGYVF